jgi:hypothetical protein
MYFPMRPLWVAMFLHGARPKIGGRSKGCFGNLEFSKIFSFSFFIFKILLLALHGCRSVLDRFGVTSDADRIRRCVDPQNFCFAIRELLFLNFLHCLLQRTLCNGTSRKIQFFQRRTGKASVFRILKRKLEFWKFFWIKKKLVRHCRVHDWTLHSIGNHYGWQAIYGRSSRNGDSVSVSINSTVKLLWIFFLNFLRQCRSEMGDTL